MNQSIIDKIKKALNLANNNPNQEEAENAMLLAQKLMAKHNIEMNQIVLEDKINKEVGHDLAINFVKKMPWWYTLLGNIIADNFKCTLYHSKGYKSSALGFIGFKEDIEIAKIILDYAINVIDYNAKKYVKKKQREGWLTRGLRDDYIQGFLAGLKAKFQEQIDKENWGLILVKDEAVIEYTNKNFKHSKSHNSFGNGRGDSEAYNAGYEKGKQFQKPDGHLRSAE